MAVQPAKLPSGHYKAHI